MKKLLITTATVVTAVLMFSAGVYASDYIKFTGEDKLDESNDKVGEIIDILEKVADGKVDAEKSLAEAIERIEELENKGSSNKDLEKEIKRLEKEVEKANKKVGKHSEDIDKSLDKAIKIRDKQ